MRMVVHEESMVGVRKQAEGHSSLLEEDMQVVNRQVEYVKDCPNVQAVDGGKVHSLGEEVQLASSLSTVAVGLGMAEGRVA